MTSRALINPLPKNSGVSLRATIQNPRPRKYASDADRQKAFRERQAVIQVRVKPETVETFDRIASTLGYSRQEVVYALLMSGLNNNRNWQQTGIPAFRLPRYEENPTMRKATPAQLAARERFAEMARSGAFKRKAKKNPAKKTVSQKISQLTREGYPQKQAVAIALSEERAGKVKKNPIKNFGVYERFFENFDPDNPYKNDVLSKLEKALVVYERSPSAIKYVKAFAPKQKAKAENIRDAFSIVQKELENQIDFKKSRGYKQSNQSAQLETLLNMKDYYDENIKRRRSNPVEAKERKPRVVLITNPKQRMLNISWLTAGGQREIMKVPIDFVFTHYVGNVAERFFARTENGQLIVSEYSTGGKIGQVPFTMRSAALNDRAAAKRYVGEMLSRIGAERFKAAVKKFEPIN